MLMLLVTERFLLLHLVIYLSASDQGFSDLGVLRFYDSEEEFHYHERMIAISTAGKMRT